MLPQTVSGSVRFKGGGGYQVENFSLFSGMCRQEGGEFSFLGTADDKIRDVGVFRVCRRQKLQQVCVIGSSDPLDQHRNNYVSEGGVV